MKILKGLLMIITAPVILVLTLFVWLCTGLIYISGLVLGLFSTVIALLGVAVLLTYSPQNGVILLVMAFLITLRNSGRNMRKKFCSTRLLRMPLMRWASRSCPRSKSCRRSTRNCWKKRKRPMPSTGVPVRKCGSF